MNKYIAAISFVILLAGCQLNSDSIAAESASEYTLILVRHAEKDTSDGKDPGLTAAGKQRALRLASLLDQQTVEGLYSTDYNRTRSTLLPLSSQKELEVKSYDPRDTEFLNSVLKEFSEGGTIVISGHSNTIPNLVNTLIGSEKYEQLNELDYNDIFVCTGSVAGNFRALHLSY